MRDEETDEDAEPAADLPLKFVAPPAFYRSQFVPQRCIMTGEKRDLILHNFRVKAENTDQEIVIGRKPTVQLSVTRRAAFRLLYGKTLCCICIALGAAALFAGGDGFRERPLIVLPFPFNVFAILVGIGLALLALWTMIGLPLVMYQDDDIAVFIPRRAAETHAAFEQALAEWEAEVADLTDA